MEERAAASLPASVAEIDATWLTDALTAAGTILDARVTSIEARVIGEGSGFAGQLARLSLRYEPLGSAGPATIIAKLPVLDPSTRSFFMAAGIYEAESAFYRDLARDVPLRTPHCYFNGADATAGNYVLLLEDLAPARTGNQIASCTRAEAEAIVRGLARLQAQFWDSPKLDALPWLNRSSDPRRDLSPLLPFVLPAALERAGDLMSPKVREMASSLGNHLPRVTQHLSTPPSTLTHGDYRLDNMFFDVPDARDGLAFIDWQAAGRSKGPADLVYFLNGNLRAEDRQAWESDLSALYLEGLREGGVHDYSADACRRDMSIALLQQLAVVVLLMAGADLTADGRGPLLARTMLQRNNAIFEETEFSHFLE